MTIQRDELALAILPILEQMAADGRAVKCPAGEDRGCVYLLETFHRVTGQRVQRAAVHPATGEPIHGPLTPEQLERRRRAEAGGARVEGLPARR